MASSPFYTIYIGSTGTHWHQMPAGAYIPGLKPKRRVNLVEVPLMHGAINIADRKFKAMTVPLVIEFYEDTAYDLAAAIETVMDPLETHEGEYVRVDDEESSLEMFRVQYEEVNEPDVTFTRYAKMKVATVTFPLLCTTKPYVVALGIGD